MSILILACKSRSQNNKIIIESEKCWVGGDLKAHPVPTPAMGWLTSTSSGLALGTSRDGAPQLTGQQCQGFTTLQSTYYI